MQQRELPRRRPRAGPPRPSPPAIIGAPVGDLDVPAAVSICQAISAEVVLDSLIDTLMVLALEQGGAERGLLVLPWDDGLSIGAEATRVRDTVRVRLRRDGVAPADLPASILRRVVRTRASILLEDASLANGFSRDPYFRTNRSRSVLCMPLPRQSRLAGALYLESPAPGVFTPSRVGLLRVLASQAAISLENARRFEGLERQGVRHKRVEKALQESEERFRRLADAIPEVIWITDLRPERVLYASPSFERIWGLPVADLYRNPRLWTEAIHPEDRTRIAEVFSRWIDGEEVDYQDIEYRIVRPDGGIRWIHERGVLSFDKHGKACRASGISTDITDRRLAEDRLRRSEAYLAEAQRLSLTGSFGWNVETGALVWSNETYALVGVGREIRPTLDVVLSRVHPDDLASVKQTLDRATREGSDLDFEHRLVMTDGSVKQVHVLARAVKEAPGGLEYVGAVTDVTARERSRRDLEKALQEMQALKDQFRIAIDTIPGLVWTALPDGHVDFLNQRWLEYTGLSQEEAGGWGWQATVFPQDLPGLLDVWRGLLATGLPGEAEARLRRLDGTYRWFLFRAVPLHDARGRLVKWYGQTTDIEDRKRAEALLAGEKRLLEMVAGSTPLPLFLDALCRFVEGAEPGSRCSILLVDPCGKRVEHGAAPSLPSSYTGAIHGLPVDLHAGPCGMAATLKEQVIVADIASDPRWDSSEWRALALAHGLRSCWSTPIVSLEGKVLGTFAVSFPRPGGPSAHHQGLIEQCTHIASIAIERARTEGALRRSEASLARAQRLSSTGSFSWRVESGEMTLSEETYRILELDPAITPTTGVMRDRIHPEDLAVFREMLSGDGRDFSFECRVRLPRGPIKHLQVVASAVRDESNRLLEWVGAVRDVTLRKQSEDALNRVRAELAHVARVATLGELTASIAHEVNQPLSGIMANASTCLRLLAATPPDLEEARDTARRTLRDGKRAADVIARLRSMFRKKGTTNETVHMNEAIREVITLTRNEVQKHRVVLSMDLAADLPPVTGDRVQLQQVVLNLILNATEAMGTVEDRPRDLVIGTQGDGPDGVRVVVRDSGIGLDPLVGDRIFEAFYTSKSDGMGMGLSIARSIVESHGGRIWVEAHDGPGAIFAFSLPARVPDHPQDPPPGHTKA